jgi:lysozyme
MRTQCLDVSHHQGPIKWSRVRAAGYRCVFIKATQGHKFVDPMYVKNVDGAMDAGFAVIPYHFIDSSPADLQAGHFLQVGGLQRKLPCMLDWERVNNRLPPISIVEKMIDNLIIATDRAPVIYHGLHELSSKKINACPWFVPKWGPEPKVKWLFWQDTDKAQVDGIRGNVDHDWFNGSWDELERWFMRGDLPKALK